MIYNLNIIWYFVVIIKFDRQFLNGYKSCVFWFIGLFGLGKLVLVNVVDEKFYCMGIQSYVFDGDNICYGLNKDFGFWIEDRIENIC